MVDYRNVREYGGAIDYDLEGSIDEAIIILQKLKEAGWENLEYTCGGYDDTYHLYPYKSRLENKTEFERRIEEENRSKEYRRRNYEALKKEFEEEE